MSKWLGYNKANWRSIFFSLSLLAGNVYVPAQNLVPNGSFEDGFTCPTGVANLDEECEDWYSSIIPADDAQPTPDWYHSCSEIDFMVPPVVAFGDQEPSDGNGYAGIATYTIVQNPANYRELIGVELNEPLEIGQTYLVEFDVSSLNPAGFYLVHNKIGFNFSTHPTYDRAAFPLNQSHFAIDTILTFSDEWSRVSEIFEADSAYRYLHIGNFFDDSSTAIDVESEFSQAGYYVIDNVSVTYSLSSTLSATSLEGVLIFPNPSNGIVKVSLPENLSNPTIKIYTLAGEEILMDRNGLRLNLEKIDLTYLKSGTYILQITTKNNTYYEKIIKY